MSTDQPDPPRHLTKDPFPRPGDVGYGVDGPGEYWCQQCGARVTRGDRGEYGHARDCEHSVRPGGESR